MVWIGVSARGSDAVSVTVLHPLGSPTPVWVCFDVQLGSLDVGLLKAAESVCYTHSDSSLIGVPLESRILQVV